MNEIDTGDPWQAWSTASALLTECRERVVEKSAENDRLRVRIAAEEILAKNLRAELEAARNALDALREITGSDNTENPWLGVTASVALVKLRGEAAKKVADAVIVYLAAVDTFGKTRSAKEYFDGFNPANDELREAVSEYRALTEGKEKP